MRRGGKKIPADPADNRCRQQLIENRTDALIMKKVKLFFWFDVFGLLATIVDRHEISP
jgi:hypothetical protein